MLHSIRGMGGGGAEPLLAYPARPLIARGWEVHVAFVAGGLDDPTSAERRVEAARKRAVQWSMTAAAAEYDSVYRLLRSCGARAEIAANHE